MTLVDQKRRQPIPALTGLRFFAAISVAIAHAAAISLRVEPASQLFIVKHWLTVSAGFGMSLFFVLSGFVIHYNYAERLAFSGLRGGSEFFWARFSRLYPLYFFVLFIELASSNLIPSYISTGVVSDQVEAISAYATLSQSWGYKVIGDTSLIYAFGSVIPVTWSISTEWFFYLMYPAVLFFVGRLKSPVACLAAFLGWSAVWAAIMLTASGRSAVWTTWAANAYGYVAVSSGSDHAFARWALYFSPYARVGEFILGVILAQLWTMLDGRKLADFERRFGGVFSALSVLTVVAVLYFMYAIGGTSWIRKLNYNFGLAIPIAFLIFCTVRYDTILSWICSRKCILFLGEASYSIYLMHFFVYLPFMARSVEQLPAGAGSAAFLLARFLVMIALVLILASATYQFIELPSRSYLRKMRFDGITKRYSVVGALLPILCAAALWFAIFGPATGSNPNEINGIIVTHATYGKNCGAIEGNITRNVAKACNRQKQCSYIVDVRRLGDPAPNCGKDFVVEFRCGDEAKHRRVQLPGEAGLGSRASLSCEP